MNNLSSLHVFSEKGSLMFFSIISKSECIWCDGSCSHKKCRKSATGSKVKITDPARCDMIRRRDIDCERTDNCHLCDAKPQCKMQGHKQCGVNRDQSIVDNSRIANMGSVSMSRDEYVFFVELSMIILSSNSNFLSIEARNISSSTMINHVIHVSEKNRKTFWIFHAEIEISKLPSFLRCCCLGKLKGHLLVDMNNDLFSPELDQFIHVSSKIQYILTRTLIFHR